MSRYGWRLPSCARIRPVLQPWAPSIPRRCNSTFQGAETFESFVAHHRPVFWRPIFFSIGVGAGTYGLAAYCTNEDTKKWARELALGSWWSPGRPVTVEMQRARKNALHKRLSNQLKTIVESTKGWPALLRVYFQRSYITFAESWLRTSDGQRAAINILLLNAAVFVGWQIPMLRNQMAAHFLHSPLSGKSYTLVTSAFSHQSYWHIGFNMFALYSFGSVAFNWLGEQQIRRRGSMPESTYAYHSYAFYMLAGIFSSLVSHVVASRFRFPRIVAALASSGGATTAAQAAQATSILPSLGASGAIYATVTLSALAFPDQSIAFIFLPWVHFPITAGVSGMVLLDIVGVLRGWRVFDHWAHLGGAAFGVFYYYYGPQLWNWTRRRLDQRGDTGTMLVTT